MAGVFKDIPTATVASTLYTGGKLVARNVTATLPEISMTSAETKAGGTVEVPVTGQVEAMEASFTLPGVDDGFREMSKLESQDIELRWVQDKLSNDGKVAPVGYKAFLRGYPKTIPGASVEVGSAPENEMTIGVTRYQLFADGEEVLCIDQLNDIFKVGATDYAKGIASLL